MRGDFYQILLILAGVTVTALFGAFLYREIFPEYKLYQEDYVALEEFRSSYTHEFPPSFQYGIKQIVLEREDNGPPVIDRCTSCHVALEIPYFSPTKLAHDANGKPIQVPNEDYIWDKLNVKITELRDKKVIEQLEAQGKKGEIKERLELAEKYEALKTAHVGEYTYDVSKVLSMHPLMGNETYPFQFHPIEEYGCTSCHNGNGRGLVTDKAHGPVFDGQYEIEDLGPTPHFTQTDLKNDPKFSRIFNHKPGESLVFQTEPIFVGPLIQAKCVQCHQTSSFLTPSVEEKTPIDRLTTHYQRGMELYISQACYACHRIAGFARGGVGPELTYAGNSYPWYLKRKLVWPQGDLPTSTMPNMHFDSVELQDLISFLLAQKGSNSATGKTAYKSAIAEWEAGKKAEWEKPVSPTQIHDLRASMTIFATEGCAACHRLQGFESNVGFANDTSKQLYEKQNWFRHLFPEVVHLSQYDEELPGSDLVAIIEKHAKEIDEEIVADVRTNGLLEEIDKNYPDVIASFYSTFRYAARAKDDHFTHLIEQEKDPNKIALLNEEWQAWKERVHRVLMTYIQIYGLGRLIGPHLNWSGIYRSDEWLMEHFRNPSSHVPRSLMPVFPFDDTKFYALTNMLDKLANHNRDALRQMWTEHGFAPSETYDMLCAQCHGVEKFGNGAIAEWIYPIPKNLHNGEFLRNLTKEKAIYSITHGVIGTPMAPWGEVASDKHQNPVLNQSEIMLLVNWLFSSLPGGEVIRESTDVPKWQYTAKDASEELNHALFDQRKKLTDTGEESYYIKKEYYTPQNIEEGKEFFLTNCAVCHGNEADGNSLRAGVMQEAKPRILTNLDWIESRDDLRLLRSIKFGIPGTAMTPWGDLTNPLQRMQLVIFIRSLSFQQERRDDLLTAIYQVFDSSFYQIENYRIKNRQELEKLQNEQAQLATQKEKYEKESIEKALEAYQKILELEQKITRLKAEDDKYLQLEDSTKNQKTIYFNLGVSLISKDVSDNIFQDYLEIIRLNHQQELIRQKLEVIVAALNQQMTEKNHAEIEGLKKLRDKLVIEIEDALRLAIQQKSIVQEL